MSDPDPDPDIAVALVRLGEFGPAVAEEMEMHDRLDDGCFPDRAWLTLDACGATGVSPRPTPSQEELALVRAVAALDVSLGRIFDGHLNGVSRLAAQVDDEALVAIELDAIRAGRLRLGVWGADPAPGEGEPARMTDGPDGILMDGTKTFCSGAGGLQRAFVLTRYAEEPRATRMAYVDLEQGVTVDKSWYRGTGMRGSASHRVRFTGARVLWVAPQAGALLRQPYFAGDAVRTAASWAGGADIAVHELITILRKRPIGDLEALAVARVRAAQRTIGLWLDEGARVLGDSAVEEADLKRIAIEARSVIADNVRVILDESARIVGSRPFATGRKLERARRDLETYLLQHRLEPLLVAEGRCALETNDAQAVLSARVDPSDFEALYRRDPDPWNFGTSRYELDKYSETIDALEGERFPRALELGCSIGVLTTALAPATEQLVAIDSSPTAVAAARERLGGSPGVTLLEATLPEELPAGPWNLIVASEILYYFDTGLLDRVLEALERELVAGGTLLAVHYTDEAPDHRLSGDAVHAALLRRTALRHVGGQRHRGYRIDRFERR